MSPTTFTTLTDQLQLADELFANRDRMHEPQDLPGRFGRVIASIDRVLGATACEAVVAGGWAVWRHGYVGRITRDVDFVLPSDRIAEFLRVAAVSGFDVLRGESGSWPKLLHRETGIQCDVLPEGARPGTADSPAPTTIPPPSALGASGPLLRYISLAGLVELKLAAGRARDEADIIELVRVNQDRLEVVRRRLSVVDPRYLAHFDSLVERAAQQTDR